MARQCTSFNQVISRMSEWGFDLVKDDTLKNKKTCLWFEGLSYVSMQYQIGHKYHVVEYGMRGGLDVLQVTRV